MQRMNKLFTHFLRKKVNSTTFVYAYTIDEQGIKSSLPPIILLANYNN